MDELTNYIRKAREAGLGDDAIRTELAKVGWKPEVVDQALKGQGPAPVQASQKPVAAEPVHSDALFAQPKRKFNYKYIAAAVSAIVILGGGYFAYGQYASNPERIWVQAMKNLTASESGSFIFEASYTETFPKLDPSETEGEQMPFTGDLVVLAKAEGKYAGSFDDPNYEGKGTFGVKLGSFNFNFEAESRKIGKNVFYKLSGNPFAMFFGGTGETRAEWAKVNLDEQKANAEKNSLFAISEAQSQQMEEALKNFQIVKPLKLLGSEKLNGKSTWHYEAVLDKEALGKYLEEVYRITGNNPSLDLRPLAQKLELKKGEVWINKSDKQLSQMVVETNFPSLITASLESARGKSRDAKRIADTRQIQTALELYNNDHSKYPAALDELTKGNFSIMAVVPTAPVPADGQCTDQTNAYRYESVNNGADYSLKLCVGLTVGGYGPGELDATSRGLVTLGSTATSTNESAVPKDEDKIKEILNGPFSATLSLRVNLSKINEPVEIEEPQGAVDLSKQIENRSSDALEVAHVRQIQSALELYFNDKQRYPAKIMDMNPAYLQTVPKPRNTTGSCAGVTDDYFNYRAVNNGQDFELTFCLMGSVSGLDSGRHIVTSQGIK